MTGASEVEHSASYVVGCCWLLAVVFVSAAGTPHLGAFAAGGTLSEQRTSIRKYLFEVYVEKNRDSTPSVDKKPSIGKCPGVGPSNKNMRLTPNRRFLLVGLCCTGWCSIVALGLYTTLRTAKTCKSMSSC